MVAAVIMASGSSKRIGVNKLLLPYKGKCLIEHLLDVIIKCDFSKIILVAKDKALIDLGKKRGIEVIYNKHADKGQSEAIKLGIQNSLNASGYAFLAGDQPFIDCEMLNLLITNFSTNSDAIIVPTYKEKRGTPVIFPNNYQKELLNLKGDVGGKAVINAHLDKVKYVEVNSSEQLWDIDTLDDYEKIINHIRS